MDREDYDAKLIQHIEGNITSKNYALSSFNNVLDLAPIVEESYRLIADEISPFLVIDGVIK